LVALHGKDQRLSEISLAAALEYAHYIHGVNPLGLVYLTNMTPAGASHSAATMFHAWFASGTRWQRVTEQLPGPPPGFLVGTQSAILDRFMLQRAARVGGLPLLRCADVRVVPAQLQAAVGAAARQVVSSVQ
jgi:hypothetical protein